MDAGRDESCATTQHHLPKSYFVQVVGGAEQFWAILRFGRTSVSRGRRWASRCNGTHLQLSRGPGATLIVTARFRYAMSGEDQMAGK